MEFLHQDIAKEYERWMSLVGSEDPYRSAETLGIHDVLLAHFLIADYFAKKQYGMGGIGPRNLDLLHSSLSRQFTAFGGQKSGTGYMRTARPFCMAW